MVIIKNMISGFVLVQRFPKNFTVMGDPVNLGARLEGANKAYGTHIIVSDRTRELVAGKIPMREVDVILVKGKQEPTRVHELMGEEKSLHDISLGLAAYRQQHWSEAEAVFKLYPNDPVSRVYLQRISQLRHQSLPVDWDGVWAFTSK